MGFVTSAGQVRVTNVSGRIVASLLTEINDPCAEAILHLIKSHLSKSLDFGLSLGSLTCDLLLSNEDLNSKDDFFELASESIQNILQEEKMKLDICDINHLLALVRSVGCQFFNDEFLFLKIIEVFIKSMPDNSQNHTPGQVNIQIEKGKDFTASVQKGFLYAMPEIQSLGELRWSKFNEQPIKILLSNIQLKENSVELTDKPDHLKFEVNRHDERKLMKMIANKLLEFCLENDVALIANQKVFDTSFVDLFLKKSILVLPRIGTQGMGQLQSMCKCSNILTSIGQFE